MFNKTLKSIGKLFESPEKPTNKRKRSDDKWADSLPGWVPDPDSGDEEKSEEPPPDNYSWIDNIPPWKPDPTKRRFWKKPENYPQRSCLYCDNLISKRSKTYCDRHLDDRNNARNKRNSIKYGETCIVCSEPLDGDSKIKCISCINKKNTNTQGLYKKKKDLSSNFKSGSSFFWIYVL